METPATPSAVCRASLEHYGADQWGRDFLRVSPGGTLRFLAPDLGPVDLQALCDALAARGIQAPFVVRFPAMVEQGMARLRRAFDRAAEENAYPRPHVGVYPLKVNPRRCVVDTVVRARTKLRYGLEAGSKPELLLAMAQPPEPGLPLLLNGFKDHEFMRMAFHAAELGHEVVVVLESHREVRRFLDVRAEEDWQAAPRLGVRAKLYSKGSGRWQRSGGETAKFGLSTAEILKVLGALEDAGLLDQMVLLHFHIGSQITRIKQIKRAVREAIRLYVGLQSGRCPSLQFLDLGGGIGVDYDGSRTSYTSSVNYSVEEYASQVVYEIASVVEETGAVPPVIITESGRALVAAHAVTVTDLREVQGAPLPVPPPGPDEHRLVAALRETLAEISAKNYEEYFHDAVDFRDEVLQLFSAGILSVHDRAAAEGLFQQIRLATARIVQSLARPSEEIVEYLQQATRKYLANFSIFQSLPDAWSIDHVFPAAPLSHHDQRPTVRASVVDITCDSDGCMQQFAHPDENLTELPLHEPAASESYYLGFFMTGAYQDSLGAGHNLFGRCHEVVVHSPGAAAPLLGAERMEVEGVEVEVKMGLTNGDMLAAMDHDPEALRAQLRDRHLERETTLGKPWALGLLQSYPYLARTLGGQEP